jgi:hypothetical protein
MPNIAHDALPDAFHDHLYDAVQCLQTTTKRPPEKRDAVRVAPMGKATHAGVDLALRASTQLRQHLSSRLDSSHDKLCDTHHQRTCRPPESRGAVCVAPMGKATHAGVDLALRASTQLRQHLSHHDSTQCTTHDAMRDEPEASPNFERRSGRRPSSRPRAPPKAEPPRFRRHRCTTRIQQREGLAFCPEPRPSHLQIGREPCKKPCKKALQESPAKSPAAKPCKSPAKSPAAKYC